MSNRLTTPSYAMAPRCATEQKREHASELPEESRPKRLHPAIYCENNFSGCYSREIVRPYLKLHRYMSRRTLEFIASYFKCRKLPRRRRREERTCYQPTTPSCVEAPLRVRERNCVQASGLPEESRPKTLQNAYPHATT